MALAHDDIALTSDPSPALRSHPGTAEARRAAISRLAELLSEGYSRMPMFP